MQLQAGTSFKKQCGQIDQQEKNKLGLEPNV